MKIFTAVNGYNDDTNGRVSVVSEASPDHPLGGVVPLQLRTREGALRPGSPDGHSWGYAGSGPAQLALDMLWEVFGEEPAPALLQAYKNGIIARLDQDAGFRITEEEIRLFVQGWGGFQPAQRWTE